MVNTVFVHVQAITGYNTVTAVVAVPARFVPYMVQTMGVYLNPCGYISRVFDASVLVQLPGAFIVKR